MPVMKGDGLTIFNSPQISREIEKGKLLKVAFINQPWTVIEPPVSSADSIGIWTYQVACRLLPTCEVILYSKRDGLQKLVEDYEGIHYRRVSATFDRLTRAFKLLDKWQLLPPKHPFFASRLYNLEYIYKIAADLKKQKCNIVHIHNFSQFIPIIRALNPKIKIVLHMHCEWLTQLDHTMIEQRLRQVDLVIGCSEYITEKIRRCFPELSERCQTVFNGVSAEQFIDKNAQIEKTENSIKPLLFVGRLSPEKGLHVLLDAFQEVVKHFPQAQLKIIGPEAIAAKEFIVTLSDEPKVRELAQFYPESYLTQLKKRIPSNLTDQVVFTGAVAYDQLLTHYRDANIVINPSLSEAFGMSLVEGMAAEVPVIGARVGGMRDIIEDGKTGLLVEPGDASALAKAIIRLLADKELRESMGKAGRQRVLELFSWNRVTETLLYHYKNICNSYA